MRTKVHEREEAIKLRVEKRMSLDEICKELHISKGSASIWLKGYSLTPDELLQRRTLNAKRSNSKRKPQIKTDSKKESYIEEVTIGCVESSNILERDSDTIVEKNIIKPLLSRKQKGDIGFMKALSSIVEEGYYVFVPILEHKKYDFIIEKNGKMARTQVKYASLVKSEYISIVLRSFWCDTKGVHTTCRKKMDYDLLIAYCPDTKLCYYLADSEFNANTAVRLRIKQSQKISNLNGIDRIRWSSSYENLNRAWNVLIGTSATTLNQ
jgi:transcriptional regulator with XRE-family HTH domain